MTFRFSPASHRYRCGLRPNARRIHRSVRRRGTSIPPPARRSRPRLRSKSMPRSTGSPMSRPAASRSADSRVSATFGTIRASKKDVARADRVASIDTAKRGRGRISPPFRAGFDCSPIAHLQLGTAIGEAMECDGNSRDYKSCVRAPHDSSSSSASTQRKEVIRCLMVQQGGRKGVFVDPKR